MFRFANPQYLWLLLAVPALVALFWLAMRNRRRRLLARRLKLSAADGSHASAAPAFWRS